VGEARAIRAFEMRRVNVADSIRVSTRNTPISKCRLPTTSSSTPICESDF